MKKVLYFEGAGMDFKAGEGKSDVCNYRIRTAFKNNECKKIYIEMSSYEKSKRDKRECFKAYEVGDRIGHIDHLFYIVEDEKNYSELHDLKDGHFLYTRENILNLINERFNCSFESIEVLEWLSGYNVHGDRKEGISTYNLMDDFVNVPERTNERNRIYKEVAKDHFNAIYKKHAGSNPSKAYLFTPERNTWSLVEMDDNTITLKSHTYKELIDDSERVKVFEVKY